MRNLTPHSRRNSVNGTALTRDRRGGAVIIVVLALLSLMIFLGVFFFEFVQEEQLAAQNYATNPFDPLNPDRYFDEAEKQLIVGPESTRTTSALSSTDTGVVHSLVAHVTGRLQYNGTLIKPTDVLPHNGHGITTMFRATIEDANSDGIFTPGSDYVSFDFNGDGAEDAVLDPTGVSGSTLPAFGINFSRPAQVNPATDAFTQAAANALLPFQPDVEYTYPDINNLFLAYDMTDPVTGRRILVPSFHRPDLFPTRRQSGSFSDLYTNANTKRLVMRPHSLHLYPDNTTPRFLTAVTTAQSGDRNRQIQPFPFTIDSNQNGTSNEQGIYSNPSNTGNFGYDLDVDVNGDGEPDGIWMDLGMDIVDMADGRQFVPLVSFYILDADSLINLNTAGNLQGLDQLGATYNSNNTTPITPFSVSNTGASASEINPMRALDGNPLNLTSGQLSTAQAEHAYIYGFSATAPQSIATMANMEWLFLTNGRITRSSSARLTGRYGEEYKIGTATPPRAGVTGYDDDFDELITNIRYRGGSQRTEILYDPREAGTTLSLLMPPASHPVDPRGTGSSAIIPSGTYVGQQIVAAPVPGSPVVWPQYAQGWEAPAAVGASALPVVQSPYPYGGTLFNNGTPLMQDEDDETRIANPDRVYDDIFRTEESLKLQLSSADYQRIGGRSRVEVLAPFNFVYSHTAPQTLRRFTPDSWDLSEMTFVPSRYASGTHTETSVWTGSRRFFPPAFGSTLFTATDPIRPEVRALMASEDSNYVNSTGANRRETNTFALISGSTGTGTASLWRQPLNLNKLLVGFDADGYPVFRHLMPHPDMVALENQDTSGTMPAISIPAMIHDHTASIPATAALSIISTSPGSDAVRAQSAAAMEWWARYDRQRMARDIYTLLYMVGAPNGTNPVTTAYPKPEMVREMAQFAVNYVDALDRDDVITKFEYDDNLSDGWNSSPSKVVYGVERASLSFSEVQFVQTKFQSTDFARTLHNEKDDLHQFLHMELRNGSPDTVNLAEGWRISRVASGTGTRDGSVQFKTKGFGTAGHVAKQILPGANFLIGTHDGTVKNGAGAITTSDLYIDVSGGSELESILPYSANTITDNMQNPNPQTDLDLSITGRPAPADHENYVTYIAKDAASTYMGTQLVEKIAMTAAANVKFDLVLERRQNPYGVESGGDTTSLGEWIEVDRFHVDSDDMDTLGTGAEFAPASDTQPVMNPALLTLNSVERRQPFDPVQIPHNAGGTWNHSMSVTGTKNAANAALLSPTLNPTLTQFSLWQPHYDRDFTSAYELLSVPLYGNWPLTELVNGLNTETTAASPPGSLVLNTYYKEIHGGSQFNLAPGGKLNSIGKMTGDFTAGIRFNFPNGIPGRPYQGWNPYAYQNCWYRLFDFVTVPRLVDRQNETILTGSNTKPGSTKPVFRVPGKINLNTMRDETILAALLDDDVHLAYGSPKATDDQQTAGRNWFLELLQSRDGTDYFANAAGFPQIAIPNSLVSHPFRGTSLVDPDATTTFNDRSVENGLLRSTVQRNGTFLNPRPVGATYTTPTLTSPTSFSATGLWGGMPPQDTSMRTWQSLFEAELNPSNAAYGNIDHHTRNRILAKIANNSTNKSHVFFVWTAVGYFEAHRESTSGNNNVQIGARLTDIPVQRRFTVVDMTRLDDAYDTQSNTFDEKKFILLQKRLR